MMGYVSFMEKRAQREMLKRAMEAAWTAGNCNGMVFGPLCMALEGALQRGSANKTNVEGLIDDWLRAWRGVQHLSDRNLKRNRDYYTVRPNVFLSPTLERFEQELESIRHSPDLDGPTMLAKIKDAMFTTMRELAEFNEWAKLQGPRIDFDAAKYEETAVRRGQRYWERTVRELSKAVGNLVLLGTGASIIYYWTLGTGGKQFLIG
jgi:hypothetical protein